MLNNWFKEESLTLKIW